MLRTVLRSFVVPALERAVKTFAQTLLALFLADATFSILQVDWQKSLATAGGAAVLSLLTSVVSARFGQPGSPSLVADPNAAKPVDPIVAKADSDAAKERLAGEHRRYGRGR